MKTTKQICEMIATKYGIPEETVELEKDNGIYYWVGAAASLFEDSCTHARFLSDMTVPGWIADFSNRVDEHQSRQVSSAGFAYYVGVSEGQCIQANLGRTKLKC